MVPSNTQQETSNTVSTKSTVKVQQGDEPLRTDLEKGLRFLHVLGMQTKLDLSDLVSTLFALLEELVESGQLNVERFDERRLRLQEREEARLKERPHVQLTDPVDKYALKDLPPIDCEALIPICKARCCRLTFPLSFQDLDERVVQWDYGKPYMIRQKVDGYCVHNDCESNHCTVYHHRPATCRAYDCREDKRIWLDFKNHVPAPESAISNQEMEQTPESPDGHPNLTQ
jgi:Fe-S-cluster containining protein